MERNYPRSCVRDFGQAASQMAYHGTQQWHPTMAPYHTQQWHAAPRHGTLPWQPTMAPYHGRLSRNGSGHESELDRNCESLGEVDFVAVVVYLFASHDRGDPTRGSGRSRSVGFTLPEIDIVAMCVTITFTLSQRLATRSHSVFV